MLASLAALALLFAAHVHAEVYTTQPTQLSTCTGGQSCLVEWTDDGQHPLLSEIGECDVGLYTGTFQLVQSLPSVNVADARSFSFVVNSDAGANGQYYLVFSASSINYRGYSGSFTLNGMTGTPPSGGSSAPPTNTPTGSSTPTGPITSGSATGTGTGTGTGTFTDTSTDTNTASAPSGTTSPTDTTVETGTTAIDTTVVTSIRTLTTPTEVTTPTVTVTATPTTHTTPTTASTTKVVTATSASPSATNAAGRVGSSTPLVGLAALVLGVLAF